MTIYTAPGWYVRCYTNVCWHTEEDLKKHYDNFNKLSAEGRDMSQFRHLYAIPDMTAEVPEPSNGRFRADDQRGYAI